MSDEVTLEFPRISAKVEKLKLAFPIAAEPTNMLNLFLSGFLNFGLKEFELFEIKHPAYFAGLLKA